MSTTVKKPIASNISTLIGENIVDFLLPSDFYSWTSAAQTAIKTNKPQFVSYSIINTDQNFIALIDRLSDKLLVVYEILEHSIKNRISLKKILWEAVKLLKTG
ncbi:MAG: hypothetical protein KAI40_03230 [Desulfobacterales bacterium]|nr:hypothetical protein [Desulfobacterales bacterium]